MPRSETTGERANGQILLQAHRVRRTASRQDIASCGCGGQEYLYRPRELLVALEDLPPVEEEIVRWKPERRETIEELRVMRFMMPPQVDIPVLVSRLRAHLGGRMPRLGPNHVLTGEPIYHGGPAGFPRAAAAGPDFADGAGKETSVAVLDTGFSKGIHSWLDAHCRDTAADAEQLNVLPADGLLDDEAGHGTFIAGIVLGRAPDATVDIAKVLDSEGYGDEVQIARTILRFARDDVINLSLGGYSHGDVPPLALVEAVSHVAPGSVIVAAAGNNCSDRLMWPAALKRVIAVGALDGNGMRAPFSNYGWWVDACARGVDVLSTFVDFAETAAPSGGRAPQSFNGWATWSGTSFAAPKVAGEIAAVKAQEGLASARDAAAKLLASPNRLPDLGVVLNL